MPRSNTRIEWFSDFVRLEIDLWTTIDTGLKEKHGLSLAFFEVLYAVGRTKAGSLRVGDIAQALTITVGAASKLADRVVAAGLARRELDADDRRASRLALTEAGRRGLAAASVTYDRALAARLDKTLSAEEQRALHALVKRLLAASTTAGRS